MKARWRDEHFEPPHAHAEAADAAIAALRERGSPSHDGVAARLVDYSDGAEGIALELQPLRWALRLVAGDASRSVAALCVTRAADGRWLAGRRAPWLSSWAGRWALGAGGAVDLGENPADTLVRELRRGVVGVARARARRGARAVAPPARDVRRAGVAGRRAREGDPRPRARRVRVVAERDRRVAGGGRGEPAADGALAFGVSRAHELPPIAGGGSEPRASASWAFTPLKWTSFFHSCVYTRCCLRVRAGKPQPATLVWVDARDPLDRDVACVHRRGAARIVSLRLAVAVAVLGGIGPFFGSYEFVREQRRRAALE